MVECVGNCSGRGVCHSGLCHCNRFDFYTGPTCGIPYHNSAGAWWQVWIYGSLLLFAVVGFIAAYNLWWRCAMRKHTQTKKQAMKDPLVQLSALTLAACIGRAVWLVDPFGSLHVYGVLARTVLVRGPEVIGCVALALVVKIWASIATCVEGKRTAVTVMSFVVNIGTLLLLFVTLPAYFFMFMNVEPVVMTWVAVIAFTVFTACWVVGGIMWVVHASSVLVASLEHATRREQLARFDTMLQRSKVFSVMAAIVSAMLMTTLIGFTIAKVGPGNHPRWFLVYMCLLHTVEEGGVAALCAYFTRPVTQARPGDGQDCLPSTSKLPSSLFTEQLMPLTREFRASEGDAISSPNPPPHPARGKTHIIPRDGRRTVSDISGDAGSHSIVSAQNGQV